MQLMRAWKESHPCAACGRNFPHYMMEFDNPAPGELSISRMAGSRCTAESLMAAMSKTKIFCSNHKREVEFSRSSET